MVKLCCRSQSLLRQRLLPDSSTTGAVTGRVLSQSLLRQRLLPDFLARGVVGVVPQSQSLLRQRLLPDMSVWVGDPGQAI